MKTRLKLCVMAFSICYATNLNAQLSIEGKIDNWTNGKAMLAYADMMTDNVKSWGSIDANGVLNMPLENDYLETFKKKAVKAQKNAPKGWKMKFKTVGDTFVCGGFENPLEYTNQDAILTAVPKLSVLSKDGKTEFGHLFMVSDKSIAKWLYSYGDENPTTGYYIDWIYVEQEATVSGICERSTYAGPEEWYDDTKSYTLVLEEGWNMVKYDITEVFNSASGKVFPLKTTMSVIQFLPEDLQWVVLGNQ